VENYFAALAVIAVSVIELSDELLAPSVNGQHI
jgi:hypothetical protein